MFSGVCPKWLIIVPVIDLNLKGIFLVEPFTITYIDSSERTLTHGMGCTFYRMGGVNFDISWDFIIELLAFVVYPVDRLTRVQFFVTVLYNYQYTFCTYLIY